MNGYTITVDKDSIGRPVFRIEAKGNFCLQCSSFSAAKNSWSYWLHRWQTTSKENRLLIAALIVYILDTCPDLVAAFPGGLNE